MIGFKTLRCAAARRFASFARTNDRDVERRTSVPGGGHPRRIVDVSEAVGLRYPVRQESEKVRTEDEEWDGALRFRYRWLWPSRALRRSWGGREPGGSRLERPPLRPRIGNGGMRADRVTGPAS